MKSTRRIKSNQAKAESSLDFDHMNMASMAAGRK
jgi:hypothetical protein